MDISSRRASPTDRELLAARCGPVLVDGDDVIFDSLAIMDSPDRPCLRRRGRPGASLIAVTS